jgi:hypothetical protein
MMAISNQCHFQTEEERRNDEEVPAGNGLKRTSFAHEFRLQNRGPAIKFSGRSYRFDYDECGQLVTGSTPNLFSRSSI